MGKRSAEIPRGDFIRCSEEISSGDPEIAAKRQAAVNGMDLLVLTPEVKSLAIRYFQTLPLPDSARTDAVHLAAATWYRTDYLVSWNCRHIANGQVRRMVDRINDRLGIPTPVICTPEELLEYYNDERPDRGRGPGDSP